MGGSPTPSAPALPLSRRRRFLLSMRAWVTTFAIAFAILGPLRSAVADWNDVPTGSMEPTILPGDRIFVNKLAYGLRVPFTSRWAARWGDPKPGDVVVLFWPKDGTRLVKRLIAGPGDTIALRNNQLIINGAPAGYSPLTAAELAAIDPAIRPGGDFAHEWLGAVRHAVMAIPSRPAVRNFGPLTVPADRFFVMGDNRDNSADSRFFGFVAREKIVGRSTAIALSVDPERHYLPRWGRFFTSMR